MFLVTIKFIEVISRALFIIGATYLLPLHSAGQFGIVVTLVGLFAFAGNFDRHQDIQRRAVGLSAPAFDRVVLDAVPFWALNLAALLPVFVAAVMIVAQLPLALAAMCSLILIGEQISNHAYQMATVEPRYNRLVVMVAVKNVAIAIGALAAFAMLHDRLALPEILMLWSAGQMLAVLAISLAWWALQRAEPHDGRPASARLFGQHRASFVHFQIGAVAIGSLQFDRLGVGALLPLDLAGIYFRHVLAVSFVYQFVNVAFFNRTAPVILRMARNGEERTALVARLVRDYALIIALGCAGFAGALVIDLALSEALSQRFALSWGLLSVLLSGAFIRVAADFAALLCNAWLREDIILRRQLFSFLCGGAALFALTPAFGLFGPALASVISSSLYFLLLARSVSALPRKAPA